MTFEYLPLDGSAVKRYSRLNILAYFTIESIMSLIFYIWFQIPTTITLILTLGKTCWFLIEYDSSLGYWSRLQRLWIYVAKKTERILGGRLSELLFGVTTPSDERLLHLDSIRGIASIVIASHHLFTESYIESVFFNDIESNSSSLSFLIKWYGYTMVEVFVVLSGFILAKVYWNPKRSSDLYSLVMNRLTRFYPLHILMECFYSLLSAYFILHFKAEKIPELNVSDTVKCFSLTHIWSFIPHPTGFISVCNGPSWSLSVELLMNLLMFVSIRYLPIYWSLFLFELFAYFGYFAIDNEILGNSRSMAIFYSFFIGVFLYKLFGWVDIKSNIFKIASDIAIVILLINGVFWMFVSSDGQFESQFKVTTRNMTYFATAMIFFLNQSYLVKRFLSLPLFTFLGSISFALYLSHHSTLVFLDILIHYNILSKVTNFFEVFLILALQCGLASWLHFEYEKKAKKYFDNLWK
eukprot:NODE_141_length_17903_cov_0.288643.p2 type:complete len:466 gc:universal NODE_141_length_17903_cov_0.288643:17650-16253(-)